jgi:hypothetical protein
MISTKIIKKFKEFLKKHNAWNSFNSEFKKRHYPGGLRQYLKEIHPYGELSGSFPWSNSKEGYDFWRKLNIEWMGTLKKITKNYDNK